MTLKKRRKKTPLDAQTKTGILAVVSLGATLETAARYFKREPSELVDELVDDPEFQREVKQAQEQAEVFFLKQVKSAALDAKNWRAATWSLERLYPDRYGKIKAASISLDELRALVERLRDTISEEFEAPQDREKIEAKIDALLDALP